MTSSETKCSSAFLSAVDGLTAATPASPRATGAPRQVHEESVDAWQSGAPRPASPQSSQLTIAEPQGTTCGETVTALRASHAPVPMPQGLAELLRLLRPEALRQASYDDISAAVDRAFAGEFAILRSADTDVRSGTDELARSKKAVMSAIWMHAGDYASFVGGQPDAAALTQASFASARAYLGMDAQSPSELLTLCCTLAANDLGKSVAWATEVAGVLGEPGLADEDHDVVVERAARAGLVSCFVCLSERFKQLVVDGLQMGSELNVPAWLQGEAPAGTLRGALQLRGKPEAFRLKAQEIYHDVAGANLVNRGAFMLEPMSRTFVEGFRVLDSVISGERNLDEAYLAPFAQRAADLARHASAEASSFPALDVAAPEGLALLRLLSLARLLPPRAKQGMLTVELFDRAFAALPAEVRQGLVDGLAVRGIDDGRAVFASMAPEMFVQAVGRLQAHAKSAEQVRAVVALMSVLAKVLAGTKPVPGATGYVELRDLRPLLPIVRSEAFAHAPTLLLEAADRLFPKALVRPE